MTEREMDLGDELIGAMDEALAHARGSEVDVRETRVEVSAGEVRAIRRKMVLSQRQFAPLLGVSMSGLRKWEQGQRRPMGAAATLLRVMDRAPATVAEIVATAPAESSRPVEAAEHD
jgi:putative transcriptional regulator